jgi:serine/threonine protein kinase
MKQLNNGLKIMKENKIIHRDLKLENILIKYEDNNKYIIKLADYGSSKRLNSLSKNYCNTNVGTLIYMALEILKGEKYNYKCDLWSIGVIIYRLKYGKSPFIGDITYASKNRFLGFPASKRDDIISLGYMLIYFMKGSLPWGISKNYSNVKQMKLSISIERLCYGLPIEIKDFMNYAYNLKSNENPDYYYLRNTLNRCEDNNFNIKNNEFNDLDFKECLGDIAKALSDPKMLNQILNDSKIFNRAISDPKIFNNNIFN